MKAKQLFRTLCLVAVMCMVSANALAYDIHHGGNIEVDPESGSCKILVVEEDATVDNCNVSYGVLIIGKNATLTVEDVFHCDISTIYVYGTLNIEHTDDYNYISESIVYVMRGGNLVGSPDSYQSSITTNVAPAAAGSIEKVDAQVPTPANDFVGWPDYYQQRIYSTDGSDFYPLGDFEDAALTKPIVDFDAWKTNYSKIYHAAYDELLGTMGEPCDDCPAVKVKKVDKTIILYTPEEVEFMIIQSEEL